jgi:type II secretory pathway component PulF
MPYYSWTGIDLTGKPRRGKHFARSLQELEKLLVKEEIGVIAAHPIRWGMRTVPLSLKMELIEHLSSLLKAQIRLPQALSIIASTTHNSYCKLCIEDIVRTLNEGMSFSAALNPHDIVDDVGKALIAIGESTGNLAQALERAVHQATARQKFREKVRAALFVPLLTFLFFLVVVSIIFGFVVPRFEQLLAFSAEPLPTSTLIIFAISRGIRSWLWVYFFGFVAFSVGAGQRISASTRARIKERVLLKIPVVSSLLILTWQYYCLHMLGILVKSGIPLIDALRICKKVTKGDYIREMLMRVIEEVEAGGSLSKGFKKSGAISSELETFITIGEASGELGTMILHAATLYEQRVYTRTHKASTLIQPFLLVILGFLIAGVIAALYIPLLTFSSSMN